MTYMERGKDLSSQSPSGSSVDSVQSLVQVLICAVLLKPTKSLCARILAKCHLVVLLLPLRPLLSYFISKDSNRT